MKYVSIMSMKKRLEDIPLYNKLKKKIWKYALSIIIYLLLTQLVFVFLFPLIFMSVNSVKYGYEIRDLGKEWVVTSINTKNYSEAIRLLNFLPTLKNNIIVVMLSTIGHVLSATFIAYGLARFKFPGRNLMFALTILSLIVPPQLLVMPLYIQFARFGWMNSFLPIIIPSFMGFGLKGGLFIFLFRQFFKSLPLSYEEAAKIEGCSPLGVYSKIILPISKTSILVATILSIVWHWNDYFEPEVYLRGSRMLLSQMINFTNNPDFAFQSGSGMLINPTALAGCVIITLPLIIIYFIFQKQFMQGVEFTGLAN